MQIREDTKQSLKRIKEIWLKTSDQFPSKLIKIPLDRKINNEEYAMQISEEFRIQLNSIPRLPIGRKKWRRNTEAFFMELLSTETILGIHNTMSSSELEAFYQELMEFTRHARAFAPELSFEELGQAIRNYIVYTMFKVIHRIDTGFSSAGFGYSMLYPFTDNYIDAIARTSKEKQAYNKMIRDTLEGKKVQPADHCQNKTYLLLKAIEVDYPRDKDTGIYTILLMMLDAQEESMSQQSQKQLLSIEERLDISLFKGGVSVLVDRYLINKELTEEDLSFYLAFGFFLQLADDLQDIGDDSYKGYQTIFTYDLNKASEEKNVNKLMNFLHEIMETYTADNNHFKSFVMQSSYLLILSSVIGSKEFFTEEYLLQIEMLLPVTSAYLEKTKAGMLEKQDVETQAKYMKLLDCLVSKYKSR